MTRYAELQVLTNFSFLRGGSHGEELVGMAKELGLEALAVADHNSLAGVVRAHLAAKEVALKFIPGARLDLKDAPSLLAYPTDRAAYGRLSTLLTLGQRRAGKGRCELHLDDVASYARGMIFAVVADRPPLPDGERSAAKQRGEGITDSNSWRYSPLTPALSPQGRGGFPIQLSDNLPRIKEALGTSPLYLAASHLYRGDDRARLAKLDALARGARVPLVATNDVLYHKRERRPLQDVLTCIREKRTIQEAGFRLQANAERHLKSPAEMARLFKGYEFALARTVEIAQACRFSLDELVYEYPDEPIPPGKTPHQHLVDLTWNGARWHYPQGVPPHIADTIERELKLIQQLNYAPYFLTVYDIVNFARSQGILCQGRGSAANSAVCFCLSVTNVNPAEIDLLFERFVSPERKEPPDIDVDFEHERREEVIQYIYARYGRERAALAATVISYRARSAVREVGKAMGLTEDTVAALAGTVWGMSSAGLPEMYVRQAGLDPSDPLLARTLDLADELIGFPRHLSQHVGGFVLTRGLLSESVPISNAAMEERTVIEWDKDDLDSLGLLKVDLLGLGMLTCIRKGFELLEKHYGLQLGLADVPREDPAVYDMLCRADSIGVFQVESRAQMNMLPRLKPRCFYDLVIEVAIVRPGPIQGDMVHPYLRRRDGIEQEDYPSPHPEHGPADELKRVLEKTKGVPLFQEQAMRIAMVAAKFSSTEANELRRAMATFRRRGTIEKLRDKMVTRMVARGYDPDFATRCFDQIKGFGDYGFPESHAASFAHLVYVSSWLKCHYPAVFACALLNSQPMGFYAPAQIVRCAREHGVEMRAVDVNHSNWDCTLEPASKAGQWALRLGLRQIDGLREEHAQAIVTARDGITPHPPTAFGGGSLPLPQGERENLPHANSVPSPLAGEGGEGRRPEPGEGVRLFIDAHDLQKRSRVPRPTLERLAAADAFRSMGLDRRQALWDVRALPETPDLPLFAHAATRDVGEEPHVALPQMPLSEHVVCDYQTLRLSLKAHPMQFLRERCRAEGIIDCDALRQARDGQRVSVAGVVLVRQRPGTASGVVFMTLEDETGIANTVVWPNVLERERKVVMGARLILVHGRVQRHQDIIHVVSERLEDRSAWLRLLYEDEQELAAMPALLANADAVRRPDPGSWRVEKKRREKPPEEMPLLSPADAVKHPASAKERGRPSNWHPRRHPRAERVLPNSRDFH